MSLFVFQSMLNLSFNVLGFTRLSDSQGGWEKSYLTKSAIQGRLRPATSRERETALREERMITHVFYCVADPDLNRGDFISPGSMYIEDDQVYSTEILVEVDAVREPSTAGEHWEVDCLERQFEKMELLS